MIFRQDREALYGYACQFVREDFAVSWYLFCQTVLHHASHCSNFRSTSCSFYVIEICSIQTTVRQQDAYKFDHLNYCASNSRKYSKELSHHFLGCDYSIQRWMNSNQIEDCMDQGRQRMVTESLMSHPASFILLFSSLIQLS